MSTFATTKSTAKSTTATLAGSEAETASPTAFARTPLWLVTLGAVIAGAVITFGFEALTRAMGVPYSFGFPGAEPGAMPVSGLFFAVLEVGVVAMFLATCIARWAKTPRATWRRTTIALTVISCVPSLIASSTSYSTNIALAVSHVVAALVIVPIVAGRLPETNARG